MKYRQLRQQILIMYVSCNEDVYIYYIIIDNQTLKVTTIMTTKYKLKNNI